MWFPNEKGRRLTAFNNDEIRGSDEVAGTTLGPLALLAFGAVLDLAVFEQGLHFDLAAAGAIKTLGSARCTRVLRYSCHD